MNLYGCNRGMFSTNIKKIKVISSNFMEFEEGQEINILISSIGELTLETFFFGEKAKGLPKSQFTDDEFYNGKDIVGPENWKSVHIKCLPYEKIKIEGLRHIGDKRKWPEESLVRIYSVKAIALGKEAPEDGGSLIQKIISPKIDELKFCGFDSTYNEYNNSNLKIKGFSKLKIDFVEKRSRSGICSLFSGLVTLIDKPFSNDDHPMDRNVNYWVCYKSNFFKDYDSKNFLMWLSFILGGYFSVLEERVFDDEGNEQGVIYKSHSATWDLSMANHRATPRVDVFCKNIKYRCFRVDSKKFTKVISSLMCLSSSDKISHNELKRFFQAVTLSRVAPQVAITVCRGMLDKIINEHYKFPGKPSRSLLKRNGEKSKANVSSKTIKESLVRTLKEEIRKLTHKEQGELKDFTEKVEKFIQSSSDRKNTDLWILECISTAGLSLSKLEELAIYSRNEDAHFRTINIYKSIKYAGALEMLVTRIILHHVHNDAFYIDFFDSSRIKPVQESCSDLTC